MEGVSLLHTLFEMHPSHRPATCYVADLQMEDDIKLEWLAQELGDEASLPDFAKKFKELFGEKLKGKTQKSRCLELYRRYAKIETSKDLKQGPYAPEVEEHNRLAQKMLYSMQAQVPPEELEEFEKLWDEDAPCRCRECNKALPVSGDAKIFFCDAACENANKKVTCGRVVERMVAASSNEQPGEIARRCDGKVEVVSGCLVCTQCGRGKKDAETCTKSQDILTLAKEKGEDELTELQRCLKRGAESLRIANNVWGFGKEAGPDHVPAWTKRQRL